MERSWAVSARKDIEVEVEGGGEEEVLKDKVGKGMGMVGWERW